MARKTDTRTDRQILEDLAARNLGNARAVLFIKQQREAGITRQKTTDEIRADMLRTQAALVRHPNGASHAPTLSGGRDFPCRLCA